MTDVTEPPAGANPAARLEAVFRHIATTRMAGVGLLNEVLDVEAVGFRLHQGQWLGVLITPWFMNLIGMPVAEPVWQGQTLGSKVDVELPAGCYEFLVAEEDELGPYLTNSLYSPMFGFADMDQARSVAESVLTALFTPAEPAGVPEPAGLQARLQQPLGRRGFFGALLGGGSKR